MKIAILGNCQALSISQCLGMMLPDIHINPVNLALHEAIDLRDIDVVLVQNLYQSRVDVDELSSTAGKVVASIPNIYFSGYHPDLVYADHEGSWIQSATLDYNSAIVLYGWIKGFDCSHIHGLFSAENFHRLGYFEEWKLSREELLSPELDVRVTAEQFDGWAARGCFMHSTNHPKLRVSAEIARSICKHLDLAPLLNNPEDYLNDYLIESIIWPVYPELARQNKCVGAYAFKVGAAPAFGLQDFIARSLQRYGDYSREKVACVRFQDNFRKYESLELGARSANPYRSLPDRAYWRRSIEQVAPKDVDPVSKSKFEITVEDRVMSAGSCFAQHITKTLIQNGFNYLITEPSPEGLSGEEAEHRGYNIFSARYGNIYSARQMLQLFERAYFRLNPVDRAWARPDGRYVDPFRPQLEPDGFASEDDVEMARVHHLAAVRAAFESLDVLVFTLGLTETWQSKADAIVFPVAPGVVSTSICAGDYDFVNFSERDIVEDMKKFLAGLKQVNPHARVLLTVSPVPLVATYEDRHVLVSTTYSKSALRCAAETLSRENDHVDYFPSYEIITGSFNNGAYFLADKRSVSVEGVQHVMRVLKKHYLSHVRPNGGSSRSETLQLSRVLCDEEMLNPSR